MKNYDHRQIAWVNQRHISEAGLDEAITKVINGYNQFLLPGLWGAGERASADGTKWDLYEQNLLSEYNIRYGGYGGIGYYHISDTYIALFSHFIPCGVREAVYILDGLMKNKSDIQPDTLHADTHGQSAAVFGLTYISVGQQLTVSRFRDLLTVPLAVTYTRLQPAIGTNSLMPASAGRSAPSEPVMRYALRYNSYTTSMWN